VVFLFAGKAHPQDEPGQDFLRHVHGLSRDPRFEGRILMLEGYDLALGRSLVSGVDVWLNTPSYPLEASGTSGQKAAINGVPHLSVLDGWWYEGYEDDNGWAVSPHVNITNPDERDHAEGGDVFDLLENHVVPLYYQSDGFGYSTGWVTTAKRAMISALPRFSAQRMVLDYVSRYYGPASRGGFRLLRNNCRQAVELVTWLRKVDRLWPGVAFGAHQMPAGSLYAGDETQLRVALSLNGLSAQDVRVECLLGDEIDGDRIVDPRVYPLIPGDINEQRQQVYENEIGLPGSGRFWCQIRAYPWHANLCHRLETGRVIWL
jgi:starch phosphorylase